MKDNTLQIVSSKETKSRKITLYGFDANGNRIEETVKVPANGTSVLTENRFYPRPKKAKIWKT